VPWLIFTYAIALITYLHHTHPSRVFFASRAEWDPIRGHVTGSTVLDVPRPVGWLFHDIFVHTPHHLDQRVPYYRLRSAWEELRPAVASLDVLEYRASLPAIATVFRRCKLFDYSRGAWAPFPSSGQGRSTLASDDLTAQDGPMPDDGDGR
jgi:acyl-lipid omega-6 desaturase (Delta-12 desaturase)